jgi:outer membrane receptor protein involved in Fe transport
VYGSGFLDGDGPQHLPPHNSVDISAGKSIGERVSVTLSVLNIANSRFLYGRDSSFAGTHYNNPREIIGSVHYRFNF